MCVEIEGGCVCVDGRSEVESVCVCVEIEGVCVCRDRGSVCV